MSSTMRTLRNFAPIECIGAEVCVHTVLCDGFYAMLSKLFVIFFLRSMRMQS